MHLHKLYSMQLCGVHGSLHHRHYLWLQPPSLQQLLQWEWGESEQSEYTTSKGIHEGLTCQLSLRIWPWRRLLDTTRNEIFKQCEERRGHRSSFGTDWNEAPLSARMEGGFSPILILFSLSFQTRNTQCRGSCGNCNPLLSKVESNKYRKEYENAKPNSNYLTVLSRANCSSAFEEDPWLL